MNWLDRAVAWAWPQAALRRLRARAALTVLRAYEGARLDRRTTNWVASSGSASSEIAPAIARLRNRARDLVRNNPYAARAISGLTSKGVGTGIMLRPEKTVRKVWTEFVEGCDFDGHFDLYGLQNLWGRTGFEAGEVLIRRIRTRDGIGLKLQTLEPDYIDNFKFGPLDNGNQAIAGVEIDRLGRKVALWLYPNHPGELNYVPKSFVSQRVPMEDLIHFGEKTRPGQLRFVPRLAVSMMKLRDLDEFEDAELVRKKIEACFVAFVSGGNSAQTLGQALTTTDAEGNTKRQETMAPGMIYYNAEGEQVSFGNPTATTDTAFSKRHLHAIAVGTGLTYELLTGDLSQVNYSSIRAGMLDFRALIDEWRWVHFVPVACQRVYRWFEEAAWDAGRLRTTGYATVWTPPRWPYVDPDKEVKADKQEILGGLSSLSEKLRERGFDPEEVFEEIGDERKKLAEKNIVVDVDAGTAQKAAQQQPAEEGGKKDDEEVDEDRLARALERQGDLFAGLKPSVTVNNFERELASPIELLALAVDTVADGQKLIAERVSGLAVSVETAQQQSAAKLDTVTESLAAAGQAMRDTGERQSAALVAVSEAVNESQRVTSESLARVAVEIARPSVPVFDDKGNVIGVRKVDKLEDVQ